MSINLSTYDNGYYGYLTQEVREAIGDMQNAGTFLGTFSSPSPFLARAAGNQAEKGDWGLDASSGQLYVYNENAGNFTAVGTSEAQIQSMIDASGGYGGVSTLLSSNAAIAGGATQGVSDPLNNTAGWYFKNSSDLTDKINWYYLVNQNPSLNMTLANLDGMYAIVDVRAEGSPYFTIYTAPTGSGDAGGWYKSRLNYAPADPYMDLTAYIGSTVMLYWGNDPGDFVGLPRIECTLDAFSSNGPQNGAETVMFGALSTSTGYGSGHYEFVVSDLAYQYNNIVYQSALSSIGALAPTAGDTHYVTLDGVNDYIDLTGTGNCFDLSAGAEWTLGFTVDEGYVGNAAKLSPIQSGANSHVLYNGGLHSTFGNGAGALSWNTASYMQGLQAGDKIAYRANGTHVQMWWNGVRKHQATLGTGGVTTGTPNSLRIGGSTTSSTAGAVPNWNTSVDNLMVCSGASLTDAELAEFFASDDYALYSFAGTKLTDFVTMGEDAFPNITGELSNVSGTLVNGTTANFAERT